MAIGNLPIENYVPVVKQNEGLYTEKVIETTSNAIVGGNLAVTGTSLFTGVATFTATPVFNGGTVDNTEVVTATNVITAAESGKTFFLSALAGFESTLPTAAAGLFFRFIVKTAPTSNGYTITAAPADSISGTVACSGAEDTINGVTAALTDNVILVHNVALVGDLVEFYSDGTLWYVTGNVNTYAAITANG